MSEARLTIGVPAYGNEATIGRAIESILGQSAGDFRVLISDDASPDGTGDICRDYAARDTRIVYVRQARNLNYGNFRLLLKAAETPYFMWLAGDDAIHRDFVKENLRILEAREDVVLSVSRCMFLQGGVELQLSEGTYPLLAASPEENLLRYLYRPADNSRMYGIFRTRVLKQAFPARDFYGYDYALVIGSLLHGKHDEVPEVMMYRDYTPRDSYVRLMHRDGKTLTSRLFPALGFVRDAWTKDGFPRTLRTAACLGTMMLNHHYALCRAYHPSYARILPLIMHQWDKRVAWRANPWRHEEVAEAVARSRLRGD